MTEDIVRPFEEKMVSSALLEIPRNTYQRNLNPERVKQQRDILNKNEAV